MAVSPLKCSSSPCASFGQSENGLGKRLSRPNRPASYAPPFVWRNLSATSPASWFESGAARDDRRKYGIPCRAASGGEPVEGELLGMSERGENDSALVIGSPIVIIKAPEILKTAEPMPMMRPNRGLLKPGDAGRVMDQKPKNVWAVRFAVGAFLIDRSCFEPMDSK